MTALGDGKKQIPHTARKRRERVRDDIRREEEKSPRSKAARDSPRPLHVLVSEWVHVAVKRDGAWEKPQVRSSDASGPALGGQAQGEPELQGLPFVKSRGIRIGGTK